MIKANISWNAKQMCQFLIGTVQHDIGDTKYDVTVTCCVSIPHRYGTTEREVSYDTYSNKVSIPHRYGTTCANDVSDELADFLNCVNSS